MQEKRLQKKLNEHWQHLKQMYENKKNLLDEYQMLKVKVFEHANKFQIEAQKNVKTPALQLIHKQWQSAVKVVVCHKKFF